MERIDFNRAQSALLEQLINDWERKAVIELRNGQALPNTPAAAEAERTAMQLRLCAKQLRTAVCTGDLPAGFGFQIRTVPHRGLL